VLYKKLQPRVDTHHVNYEEVSEIVEHLEAAGKGDRPIWRCRLLPGAGR
jgi:hypothetical protein